MIIICKNVHKNHLIINLLSEHVLQNTYMCKHAHH